MMQIEYPYRRLDCVFYGWCLDIHIRCWKPFDCAGCTQYKPALRSVDEWGEETLKLMRLFCRVYPELVRRLVPPQVVRDILDPPKGAGEGE
jgi:hypothetical protein